MSSFIKHLRIKLAKKKIALSSKFKVRAMNTFMKYKIKK